MDRQIRKTIHKSDIGRAVRWEGFDEKGVGILLGQDKVSNSFKFLIAVKDGFNLTSELKRELKPGNIALKGMSCVWACYYEVIK